MKCNQLFSSNFDMLAANGTYCHLPILEPIHYMEEKPFKIVHNLRTSKRKIRTNHNQGTTRANFSKGRKSKSLKKNDQLEGNIKLELETSYQQVHGQVAVKDNVNDPLFTPQMLVKCELDEGKLERYKENEEETEEMLSDTDEDADFCADEYEEDNEEADEKEYKVKYTSEEKMQIKNDFVDKKEFDDDDEVEVENEDEDEDDERLLAGLQTKSGRGNYKKTKNPRLKDCQATCKHRCTTKYDRKQRLDIYNFYWQLSQEDKIHFIRTHVRKSVSKHIRSKIIRNNCCYFLKYYNITPISYAKELEEEADVKLAKNFNFTDDDVELTKVCRKFFDGTLKISKQDIKEAFKDFELKPERIVRPPRDTKFEEEVKLAKITEKKTQQPQQYLDPATGDLTDTKPKKKFKRRKPGEPLPERFPKPIQCAIRCKFKCHEKFSESERKQICDIFWSLDYKRRKDFILSRIETTDVKTPTTPEFRTSNRPIRAYQAKFYLRSGLKSENIRVCKHFMLNTLSITRNFIENAIEFADKTTGAYTGADLRGVHGTHNKINAERRRVVLDHINSYPFWLPNKKSKTKYLHHSLTIRKMYEAYKEKCVAKNMELVSVNSYYKVFHKDFHILFLANPHPKKGRGFFKSNPNISHYTGDEPGGCWFDSKGTLPDARLINHNNIISNDPRISSCPKEWDTLHFQSNALALNLVQTSHKTFANQSLQSSRMISHGSYENVSMDSVQISE